MWDPMLHMFCATYSYSAVNHDDVVNRASEHAGESGDSSLFASALKHISGHSVRRIIVLSYCLTPGLQASEHTRPIDEEHVTNAHKQAYEHNSGSSLDSGSMGAAAAMQVCLDNEAFHC
jgi:hypothetical protein